MSEKQTELPLDAAFGPAPAAPAHLREEIAGIWGLPLDQRVQVFFRNGPMASVSGVLELADSPEFPWNPRQPLRLRITGFEFTSREIEHWHLL